MMRSSTPRLNRFRRLRWIVIVGLALAASGLRGAPVLRAQQGPPDLEALHQRLLPVFELAGVVFTDADETTGRLVVGVLDRHVEGLIRARAATLRVPSQMVDVVETEAIFQVATLRDFTRPVVAGLQIRFSGFLCSLGFNALRAGVAVLDPQVAVDLAKASLMRSSISLGNDRSGEEQDSTDMISSHWRLRRKCSVNWQLEPTLGLQGNRR